MRLRRIPIVRALNIFIDYVECLSVYLAQKAMQYLDVGMLLIFDSVPFRINVREAAFCLRQQLVKSHMGRSKTRLKPEFPILKSCAAQRELVSSIWAHIGPAAMSRGGKARYAVIGPRWPRSRVFPKHVLRLQCVHTYIHLYCHTLIHSYKHKQTNK